MDSDMFAIDIRRLLAPRPERASGVCTSVP